jgi:hypothetical protein
MENLGNEHPRHAIRERQHPGLPGEFGKLDVMMCGWMMPSSGPFPNRSLKPNTRFVCLRLRLRARLLQAASVCDRACELRYRRQA